MKIHAKAALTVKQRQEVKRLHQEGVSIRQLATRFGVNPTTIQRWVHRDSPLDLSTAPLNHTRVVTEEYRQAVLDHRKANPHHGPITIAHELQARFPFANRGTVQRIIKGAGLAKPIGPKKERPHIPVGSHRIQMDIQQLPAIEGGTGFEFKISFIHLATRVKYSEIHPECTSKVVAQVFTKAVNALPPFFSPSPTTP